MQFLDELGRYSPALTIFSAFMVAGSFMGIMKEQEYAVTGILLFFSGFLGVFWCLIDALIKYISQQSYKYASVKQILIELLQIFSWSLFSTIVAAITLFFYFLYMLSKTIQSPFSSILQLYGAIFFLATFSIIMLKYYFIPISSEIFEDVKKVILAKVKRLKQRKKKGEL